MLRQARPNQVTVRTSQQDGPAAVQAPSIWLGPLQRLKLALCPPFIRKGSPLRIPPKPLWFEKGWRQVTDTKQYKGQYRAIGRTWRGMIQHPYPGGYTAYIWHPPLTQIQRNTPHGPCFIPNGEAGRFQVYFHLTPSSLDHAITSIERVLADAYNG